MHFALLIGYGASAVNPYLAIETLENLFERGYFPPDYTFDQVLKNYLKSVDKGLRKTFSKMGISALQSYCGAQIFEAIGLNRALVDRYFTGTASRIEGVGTEVLAREARMRHEVAMNRPSASDTDLEVGGNYQYRIRGERHLLNPLTISKLQHAVRQSSFTTFQEFTKMVNDQSRELLTLRGLLEFHPAGPPVPLDDVEPAAQIVRRFATGAMSFGSISREAHETLAIAMNRIGGFSNTGEGGEDEARFRPDPNGDLRRSAIKQVASGRFGVTAHYLVNANDLQIKIAQGAKPGEGGQLPGHKVDEMIARIRQVLVSDFRGIELRPIEFRMDGLKRSASIPGLLEFAIEGVASRANNGDPLYLDNTAHPANRKLALARSSETHVHGFGLELDMAAQGNNGHFAPFSWTG